MSFQGGLIFGIAVCLMFAGIFFSAVHHDYWWLMSAPGAGVAGIVLGFAAGLQADSEEDVQHHRKK